MIGLLRKIFRSIVGIKTTLLIKDVKSKVTLMGSEHGFNKNSRVNLQWGATKDNIILNDHSEMLGSIVAINHGRVVLGEWSKIGNSIITCVNSVEIGADTAIADGVTISDHNQHPINPDDRKYMRHTPHNSIARAPMFSTNAPIIIGKNVWIGSNVRVCKGVTIGDNSVIGANSVVTKDIPANCVAVGNPARVVKTDIDKTTTPVFPLKES